MTLDESDMNELAWEDFHSRRRLANLINHPDCRDPDHDGCELCMENEDD